MRLIEYRKAAPPLLAVLLLAVLPLSAARGQAAMSPRLHKLVEDEATKFAPSLCMGSLPGVDCTCYGQKIRDYRLKEFSQVGEKMMIPAQSATADVMILTPQLNQIFNKVDYSACKKSG